MVEASSSLPAAFALDGWVNDTPLVRPPPPYTRAFVQRGFYLTEDAKNHSYLFVHRNELIMCGVGHLHPVLQQAEPGSVRVDFGKLNTTGVSGKGKHGAMRLVPGETLAHITCRSAVTGEELSFDVPCPVGGQLIDTNTRLAATPDSLLEAPYEEGYLVVLYVKAKNRQQALSRAIIGEEAYAEAVAAAASTSAEPAAAEEAPHAAIPAAADAVQGTAVEAAPVAATSQERAE